MAAAQEGRRLRHLVRGDRPLPEFGDHRPHGRGHARRRRRYARVVASPRSRSCARRGAPSIAASVSFTLATLADRTRPRAPSGASRSSTTACACWRRGRATMSCSSAGAASRSRARYPEIAAAAWRCRSTHFVIDGEIVAETRGRPPELPAPAGAHGAEPPARRRGRDAACPVRAMFFDCLALEGHDLRKVPLADRKALLSRVIAAARSGPGLRARARARPRVLRRRLGRRARGHRGEEARLEPTPGSGRPTGSRSSAIATRSS